ncbi:hypothetical protein EXIGLDRAFT_844438 [Exidia glandulosa HHB12029]|uniref:CFEM domain-containing protein n=1 Tax=Exidia glandulosa HHB12029 TaxID=1314781 RepID=A0A165ZDA6_EXIGL|nr:hypothetical protein EXIGLDRAFT_844438 [Exidia glandulosa HHB12029]
MRLSPTWISLSLAALVIAQNTATAPLGSNPQDACIEECITSQGLTDPAFIQCQAAAVASGTTSPPVTAGASPTTSGPTPTTTSNSSDAPGSTEAGTGSAMAVAVTTGGSPADSTTPEQQCLITCLSNVLAADPNPANCVNIDTSAGIEACLCTNPTFAQSVGTCLGETCTTIAIDVANSIVEFCDEVASAVASGTASGTTGTAPSGIISVSSSGTGIGSGSGPAATTSTQPGQAQPTPSPDGDGSTASPNPIIPFGDASKSQWSRCTTVAFVFIAIVLVM